MKHERNLKLLEKQLKTHRDNIQAMKGMLLEREEELQVSRTLLVRSNITFQYSLVYFYNGLNSAESGQVTCSPVKSRTFTRDDLMC